MNDEQLLRYSRHILLADFDVAGQEALLNAHVLIIGAGGLGCPVALYLAGAGIGHITLCDDDEVDWSNLQRQIGHQEKNIGEEKVTSLAAMLTHLNAEVSVTTIPYRLAEEALLDVVKSVNVVVDCSDNFATRFMLNRVCFAASIPLVSGAAVRAEGQLAVFDFRQSATPCYRCLYHDDVGNEEINCANNGVLAPIVGVVGSLQAVEVIKLLSAYGTSPVGKLLVMDMKVGEWRQLVFKKDPHCPVCGDACE